MKFLLLRPTEYWSHDCCHFLFNWVVKILQSGFERKKKVYQVEFRMYSGGGLYGGRVGGALASVFYFVIMMISKYIFETQFDSSYRPLLTILIRNFFRNSPSKYSCIYVLFIFIILGMLGYSYLSVHYLKNITLQYTMFFKKLETLNNFLTDWRWLWKMKKLTDCSK